MISVGEWKTIRLSQDLESYRKSIDLEKQNASEKESLLKCAVKMRSK